MVGLEILLGALWVAALVVLAGVWVWLALMPLVQLPEYLAYVTTAWGLVAILVLMAPGVLFLRSGLRRRLARRAAQIAAAAEARTKKKTSSMLRRRVSVPG